VGEVQRERRIGVEVVPLDQITDRADKNRSTSFDEVSPIHGLHGVRHGNATAHTKVATPSIGVPTSTLLCGLIA
jgi:hypothetical protein